MKSYIIQLDFGAAFDTVSQGGLLLKLKSIDVGGSVLSICREFLSNRRQKVLVDGARISGSQTPYRYKRATGKGVGSYSVNPILQQNV